MPTKEPPRRRDAGPTRSAILAAARQSFARAGYDGVGVREIAAGAGVTAMLVNRYFDAKEQLFAEVTAALDGEQAAQRAALVLALVAGIQVMRQMLGLAALGRRRAGGAEQAPCAAFPAARGRSETPR